MKRITIEKGTGSTTTSGALEVAALADLRIQLMKNGYRKVILCELSPTDTISYHGDAFETTAMTQEQFDWLIEKSSGLRSVRDCAEPEWKTPSSAEVSSTWLNEKTGRVVGQQKRYFG